MAILLKPGISEEASQEVDLRVEKSVRRILADIEERGDEAVRELSERFDDWSPDHFRLSQSEIDELIDSLPTQTIEDIQFAQAQVRGFAEEQRRTLQDLETRSLPGVTLGHRHIPINNVGCYVPGGRYPMVASAHMSVVTAKVAGAERVVACTPPLDRKPPAAT